MKTLNKGIPNTSSKKKLLELPHREVYYSEYDTVLLLPARTKHESGYAHINIIGCIDGNAVEIASQYADHVWLDELYKYAPSSISMDCIFSNKVIQLFSTGHKLCVGGSCSSTSINFKKIPATSLLR